ncbi:MAG: hypothetical protein ACYDBJ_07245 [Aggregatilineales bacterium]
MFGYGKKIICFYTLLAVDTMQGYADFIYGILSAGALHKPLI